MMILLFYMVYFGMVSSELNQWHWNDDNYQADNDNDNDNDDDNDDEEWYL